MKYLFTGGGTGGHLYPALAVARELAKDPSNSLRYVGIRGRAEEQVLGGERRDPKIPLSYAMSAGFPGSHPLKLLGFLIKVKLGCLQAAWHLLRFRPDLVFATGGYASAPAVFSAWALRKVGLLKTRILIHEQNVAPGLMNRKAAQIADLVALTFPASASAIGHNRVTLSGYPVRRDLMDQPDRVQACRSFDFNPDKPVLLVFGGSQGARCINRTLYKLLPDLLADGLQIIHGYGTASNKGYSADKEHQAALKALRMDRDLAVQLDRNYRPFPYLHNIKTAYAAADLVLARAGAGAIFELLTCGIPTILVPKMGLPGDHQVANARRVEDAGAARVILERPAPNGVGFQEEVDRPHLLALIRELIHDPDKLAAMRESCAPFAMDAALDGFVTLAQDLAAGKTPASSGPVAAVEPDALSGLEAASDEALLRVARQKDLDDETRRYLAYRYGAALSSADWTRRNRGVKLAGELGCKAAVPLLLHIAADPRKPRLLARLLGGRHYQNGFIRRNLATALGQIGDDGPEVLKALTGLLDDNYWEVRAEAIRALGHLAPADHAPDLVARLLGRLRKGHFEERLAALEYWNQRAVTGDWEERILPLAYSNNTRVREYTLQVLADQVRAGNLPPEQLGPMLKDMLVTSTWFVPNYPVKSLLRELSLAVKKAGEA